MKLRNRPKTLVNALERRVVGMRDEDLYSWVDQSIFALGQAVTQWQRHRTPGALQEAGAAVRALDALVAEMGRRKAV